MSQIQEAFREFLKSGNDPFGNKERELDRATIAMVHDPSLPMDERVTALRYWWWQYGVARTLRVGEHETVARSLLDHFDTTADGGRDSPDIEREFDLLTSIAAEHRHSDMRDRRLISLVSKTLWLFYPDSAPMYDANAAASLQVLSRLYGFQVDTSATPYSQFFRAWQQGFSQVAPLIPEDASMPHKVRVFDAFLWWLGQGTFQPLAT